MHFHVRPWETDLLTVHEFNALCDLADQIEEANSGG